MKMYPTNNLVPVNSKQRQPDSVTIPVFNFVGLLEAPGEGFEEAISDKWYPPTNMKITGGYVAATAIGTQDNWIKIHKSNIFEQNINVGAATLLANDNKTLFVINDSVSDDSEFNQIYGGYRYAQANVLTPFDYITISAEWSLHSGVTVQLFGEKVN